MERNFIISQIVEKKVYNIEKCVKLNENSCDLVLSEKSDKFVRKELPAKSVFPLLKKSNWLERLVFGKAYSSRYTMDVLPYYDCGWKDFVWREYIDDCFLQQQETLPSALTNFLNTYNRMQHLFKLELDNYLATFPKKKSGMLSPVMSLYWQEFEKRFVDKYFILSKLHPFFAVIPYDDRGADSVEIPLPVVKYLCMTQHIDNVDFDYVELAQNYVQDIYNYLRCSFHADMNTLTDIYGDIENIGKDVNITEYESLLLFFNAVKRVIAYLE